MNTLLPYIQIILAVLLVGLVLLQQSDGGLGSAFGGSDESSTHTRRGIEKILFNTTIIIAILFVTSTILTLII
ncbi:preprotein translocase subunit SecG [Patescibacteria group bacterium]